jgi:hypothetical protein
MTRNFRSRAIYAIVQGDNAKHNLKIDVNFWEERFTGPEGGWVLNWDIEAVSIDTGSRVRKICLDLADRYIDYDGEISAFIKKGHHK